MPSSRCAAAAVGPRCRRSPQAENALPARLAWILGLVLLAPPAWADPDLAVREAFARYVAALEARDGATAATLVTVASLAREKHLRDLALTASRATVAALPPSDQLAVLRLRHEFTAGSSVRLPAPTSSASPSRKPGPAPNRSPSSP